MKPRAELCVKAKMNNSDDNAPDKFTIAAQLRELSSFLKLKGESNSFRAKAYDNAASAIEGVGEDISKLISSGRLTDVRGIGNSIAAVITEIHATGKSKALEKLKAEYPPGILELAEIAGLSVKKVEALHEALGISTIDQLKEAINSGSIKTVKGFSDKSAKNIAEAIATSENRAHQILLVDALEIGETLVDYLLSNPNIKEAALCGAVSRWQEAVDSVDLVAASGDFENTLDFFAKFPALLGNVIRNDSNLSARLSGSQVAVNLHLCKPADYVFVLHRNTGTENYNSGLKMVAESAGIKFDDTALIVNDKELALKSDHDIYHRLGLPYIPIELREDMQVITDAIAGTTYDDLIEIDDIRGMTHCHSTFSDGVASVEAMASAVKKMNMEYMTLTDHSPTAHYANGVEPDRLYEQWAEIAFVQEAVGIPVLRGTESDILADGSLDYDDYILQQLDVVIASIHSRMKMDEDQMTTRLVNCMKQKRFKIWGHALGRLVLKREPVACRMLEVLDVAAQSRVAVEVNGDPHRLDMEPKWLREARKRKLRFVISTDAHSTNNLHNLKFGIHLARRAAIRRDEVLNTLSVEDFKRVVKP
jgi:DNA polymerase (family X)